MTEPRRLNPLLVFGVLALPLVFVWFLLRPGYSRDVRVAGFLYASIGVFAAVSVSLQSI